MPTNRFWQNKRLFPTFSILYIYFCGKIPTEVLPLQMPVMMLLLILWLYLIPSWFELAVKILSFPLFLPQHISHLRIQRTLSSKFRQSQLYFFFGPLSIVLNIETEILSLCSIHRYTKPPFGHYPFVAVTPQSLNIETEIFWVSVPLSKARSRISGIDIKLPQPWCLMPRSNRSFL